MWKNSASRWFGKVAIIEWLLRWEDSKFNGTRGICYCMCWWTLSFTVSKKAVKRWEYGWAATYTTYKCKQSKPLLWVVKEEFFPWEKINSSKSLRGVNSCVNFYDRHIDKEGLFVRRNDVWPLNRSIQSHSQSIGQLWKLQPQQPTIINYWSWNWPTRKLFLKLDVFATLSTF